MIYAPKRFLFLHMPRTGGMSITAALASLIPECDLVINTAHGRHAGLCRAIETYGQEVLDVPLMFIFQRPAQEIVDSTMRLIRRDLRLGKLSQPLDPRWRMVLEHAESNGESIDESTETYEQLFGWLLKNWGQPTRPFIGEKHADRFTVYEYSGIRQAWSEIRDRIGFDCLPLELPWMNRGDEDERST